MNHLKTIALALALILFACAIIWALSSLAEEAAKSDDYQIIIWLTPEPLAKGSE